MECSVPEEYTNCKPNYIPEKCCPSNYDCEITTTIDATTIGLDEITEFSSTDATTDDSTELTSESLVTTATES